MAFFNRRQSTRVAVRDRIVAEPTPLGQTVSESVAGDPDARWELRGAFIDMIAACDAIQRQKMEAMLLAFEEIKRQQREAELERMIRRVVATTGPRPRGGR